MRARRQVELYDGFRVDHLVGFYRTYVRPLDGREPYFMPAEVASQLELGETVMRILIDTGADVSVEDLGTVPEFVRLSIAQARCPWLQGAAVGAGRSDSVSATIGGDDGHARYRPPGCLVGDSEAGRTDSIRLGLDPVR